MAAMFPRLRSLGPPGLTLSGHLNQSWFCKSSMAGQFESWYKDTYIISIKYIKLTFKKVWYLQVANLLWMLLQAPGSIGAFRCFNINCSLLDAVLRPRAFAGSWGAAGAAGASEAGATDGPAASEASLLTAALPLTKRRSASDFRRTSKRQV